MAILVACLGLVRLAWLSSGPAVEVAVIGAVVGHLAWVVALAVAVLGGPYGAVTAVAQTAAALATVGIGLVVLRAGIRPVGEVVVVAGAAFFLPTPAAWLVVGAAWTAVGVWQVVSSRPGDASHPLAG
jgi:hypothetical protein